MLAKTEKTQGGKTNWKRPVLAAAAGLAIVAAAGWMSWANSVAPRKVATDTFFLRNASLRDPDFLNDLDRRVTSANAFEVLRRTPTVFAHRLKRGMGIVFGYRWFFDRFPAAVDDEEFEKIAVGLPEIPSDAVSTFDLSDRKSIIAVYTEGGSARPSDACSGYLNAGSLVVRKDGGAFAVRVKGSLSPKAVGLFPELCRPKPVTNEFEATELKFDELNTWLGKRGRHPYDETYRNEAFR